MSVLTAEARCQVCGSVSHHTCVPLWLWAMKFKQNPKSSSRRQLGLQKSWRLWSQNTLLQFCFCHWRYTGHGPVTQPESQILFLIKEQHPCSAWVREWCADPLQFPVCGKWLHSGYRLWLRRQGNEDVAIPWSHWGCSASYLHLTWLWSGWRQHHSLCRDREM